MSLLFMATALGNNAFINCLSMWVQSNPIPHHCRRITIFERLELLHHYNYLDKFSISDLGSCVQINFTACQGEIRFSEIRERVIIIKIPNAAHSSEANIIFTRLGIFFRFHISRHVEKITDKPGAWVSGSWFMTPKMSYHQARLERVVLRGESPPRDL